MLDYGDLQVKYGDALDEAPKTAPQRAVYFANRAACSLKLRQVRLSPLYLAMLDML